MLTFEGGRDKGREEKERERGEREGARETDRETKRQRESPCYIVFHNLLLTNLKKTVSQKITKTIFVGKVPF